MSLSPLSHIAILLPSTWPHRATIPPVHPKNLPSPTQLIGPVSDNVLPSASSNLTCINYSSPNYTGLTNSAPSFCSTWVLWNNANNCTNLGIFIICRTYAYPCLPLDPPWTLYLGLPDPGSNLLQRRRGRTNSLPPRGTFPQKKKRAVIAPLLIGTGIAAVLDTGVGGISTLAHFYYKLSQELNEDMEQVVESFISVQRQINLLASVALQNRRTLELLTGEKGETCLF